MRKTWVFFKLRMLQLRYDKTALFFCYILPVLLLLGIGYTGDSRVAVAYTADAGSPGATALVTYLENHPLIRLEPYRDQAIPPQQALANNQIRHYLAIGGAPAPGAGRECDGARLHGNSLSENQVENVALQAILDDYHAGRPAPTAASRQASETSWFGARIVNLLPGLIGMTLLIIGLNGFGALLIEEEHHGLYRNIKTIDVSPVPFLSGLFLSRLVIAYSVVVVMYLFGIGLFGIGVHASHVLLVPVVTLGAVAFLSMGLAFATISPSVTAFSGIANVVQMPLILLGGVFFSIQAFPEWVQWIAMGTPLAQFNGAMQRVLFGPAGVSDLPGLLPYVGGLLVWSVLALAVARARFRW